MENEAFDDERDGTARDKVAEDLEVVLATKMRAHAAYVRLVGQDGCSVYDHGCCLMCCHFGEREEVKTGGDVSLLIVQGYPIRPGPKERPVTLEQSTGKLAVFLMLHRMLFC